MVGFLHRAISQSGRYQPDVISLAFSAADTASLQLRAPQTWARGPRVRSAEWSDGQYVQVGAWGSELEFQRYKPRKVLTSLLQQYDLLQFVVGSPPWVCAAENVNRPIVLWTATTTRADRESQMRIGSLPRRAWSSLMVNLTARHYERRGLERADAVFALSNYTLGNVRTMMNSNDAALAPCGVDTEFFRPASSPHRKYILCVARLSDPRKNVRMLLEAYAMLQKKFDDLPDLYLIGDTPSVENQKLLNTLGVAGKVQLLGVKFGVELAELYRHALFFVLSSNEEGLGIVILEAMASGLPVVSTDCGGPATAIVENETGFLTPVGDAHELAKAMGRLVGDAALCERMGQRGRQIAEERFSLAAVGKIFLEKYDELLDVKSNGRGASRLSQG